ncbi:MAG: hypothetical protein Q7R83_01450 [bacterium]|nr:hypothetical protein [bacterium]
MALKEGRIPRRTSRKRPPLKDADDIREGLLDHLDALHEPADRKAPDAAITATGKFATLSRPS